MAASQPTWPAPTMTTSYFSVKGIRSFHFNEQKKARRPKPPRPGSVPEPLKGQTQRQLHLPRAVGVIAIGVGVGAKAAVVVQLRGVGLRTGITLGVDAASGRPKGVPGAVCRGVVLMVEDVEALAQELQRVAVVELDLLLRAKVEYLGPAQSIRV